MASYITNFGKFNPDECGAFSGFTAEKGVTAPLLFGLQKSSINTVGDFCYSPYGAVSNIDCPDWDPSCNCFISQYRPKTPMYSDKDILDLKISTNECVLMRTELPNVSGTIEPTSPSDWWGIDFANPKCPYNCFYSDTQTPTEVVKPDVTRKVNFYGPTGDIGKNTFKYPYSLGLSGINGILLNEDENVDTSRDDFIVNITGEEEEATVSKESNYVEWTKRINGPLFQYYLEYSKTDATFWNTPRKTPLLRSALISLYNFQKINITVNGDYRVKVGSLINILMPIKDELSTAKGALTDKRFAGTWMVYRIERTIMSSKHTMILYLMRDGFNTNKYGEPALNKYGATTYQGKGSKNPEGSKPE